MADIDKIHMVSRVVIRDGDDLLLCKTNDLGARNFYFLPGGHIEHNETARTALLREIKEETGADATITRYLGCLEYIFKPGHSSICHNHEYNLIFEAQSDQLSKDIPLKKIEPNLDLLWHPIADLDKIDFRAEPLRKQIKTWLAAPESSNFASTKDN